jgi:hypothetical protein
VNRPGYADLLDYTVGVERWLRRCNGQPAAGIPISSRGLGIVLAGSSDVERGADGTISWTSAGRRFTAEPVREGW